LMEEARMGHKHPTKRLTAVKVRNARSGKHADGGGLYLRVTDDGRKNWILRIVIKGKRCELGLGSVKTVSLAEAREEAARLRNIARKGGDPLAERKQERKIVPTFEEAARKVHESMLPAFRNKKHGQQWINTLRDYAFPIFGSKPVDRVESSDILEALTPIWIEKAETARRVKQRLRTVFDYAKAKGWRSSDNPVEGISKVLPKHSKSKKHFAALAYAQIPGLIESLWKASNVGLQSKLALEFLILTAARTGEVIYARWDEINLEAETWTIPAERMKARVEHRIPLSLRCLQILKVAKSFSHGEGFIFPGRSEGQPLSNMALAMALRRMGRTDITVHGFRSSFRDWAEERTNTPRSVVEAALAHQVESKVEAAYLRTTLFDKRRRLMDNWAAFATAKPAQKVVRIDGRA
jgi:integrase